MTIKRRKITGIILFTFPAPLLILTLPAYAILQFVIQVFTTGNENAGLAIIIGQVISIILSIIGIFAILALFIGTPIGIWMYLSARKQEKDLLPTPKN